MGIFSNNKSLSTSYDTNFDVVANENYDCTTGIAMTLIDVQKNDLALFEAAICSDMNEISAINEGYEVINEAATDIFKKIKELFLKLIEKIKGIFKAFMARFNGIFMDSKQLHTKYKNVIARNTNWKGFKVKDFRTLKSGVSGSLIEIINLNGEYVFANTATENCYTFDNLNPSKKFFDGGSITVKQALDKDNTIDADEIMDDLINVRLSKSLSNEIDAADLSNINKEFLDLIFEDAETKDGDDWSTSDILHGVVGDFLEDGDKNIKKIEQANTKLEGSIKSLVSKVNKETEKIIKTVSKGRLGKDYEYIGTKINFDNDDEIYKGTKKGSTKTNYAKISNSGINKKRANYYSNKGKAAYAINDYKVGGTEYKAGSHTNPSGNALPDMENIERLAGFYQRCATAEQTLVTKLTGARLNAIKFAVGQARKVWSSAAAYASVEHKNESYEYYTAVGEAVLYDYETDIHAPIYY